MPLQLLAAEVKDVPRLTTIAMTAFDHDLVKACFPRTPPVRRNLEDKFLSGFGDSNMHFLKVVDTDIEFDSSSSSTQTPPPLATDSTSRPDFQDPRIVGLARWIEERKPESTQGAHDDGDKGDKDSHTEQPDWPEEVDADLANRAFAQMGAEQKRIMGEQDYWSLGTVATHPAHQGRGIGRLLVEYGCERADAAGQEAYVSASAQGLRLYEKCGFERVSHVDTEIKSPRVNEGRPTNYRNVLLIRKPKAQGQT